MFVGGIEETIAILSARSLTELKHFPHKSQPQPDKLIDCLLHLLLARGLGGQHDREVFMGWIGRREREGKGAGEGEKKKRKEKGSIINNGLLCEAESGIGSARPGFSTLIGKRTS